MKHCKACDQDLSIEAFPWRNQTQGVRGSTCKLCMRLRNKKHYEANKQPYKDRAKARELRMKMITREARNRPCADCGVQYPYYVMDFDHVDDNKDFTISHVTARKSEALLRAEIAKCEVVCSNCHRERTHQRAVAAGYGAIRPKDS